MARNHLLIVAMAFKMTASRFIDKKHYGGEENGNGIK